MLRKGQLKGFTSFALILIVAYIVVWVGNVGLNALYETFSSEVVYTLGLEARFLQTMRGVLDFAVNLLIGIWLYIHAKRRKRAALVWCLFGLAFGIAAPILYYVIPEEDA